MARPSRVKKIALWSVSILLVAVFLMAGSLKLMRAQQLAAEFVKWGYLTWFRLFVGVAAIGGAVLLLFSRTVALGSIGLGILMAGCVFSHVKAGESPQALPAIVLLTLLAVVGYGCRPDATSSLRQIN